MSTLALSVQTDGGSFGANDNDTYNSWESTNCLFFFVCLVYGCVLCLWTIDTVPNNYCYAEVFIFYIKDCNVFWQISYFTEALHLNRWQAVC